MLTIDARALWRALTDVKGAVGRTEEHYRAVRLHAEDGRLSVSACDGQLVIQRIVTPVDGEIDVAIEHAWILGLVRQMRGRLTIDIVEQTVRLVDESGATFTTQVMEVPKELKPNPLMTFGKTEIFKLDTLKALYGKVAKHVSRNDNRPIINCVEVKGELGVVRMTATDSYRLVTAGLAHEGERFEGVVHRRLFEALRILDGHLVSLDIGKKYMGLSSPRTTVVCESTEGQFPNYQQLWPDDPGFAVDVDREETLKVLRSAASIKTKKPTSVWSYEDGLHLTITDENGVRVFERMLPAAGTWDEKTVGSAYDPAYLADCVESMGTKRVRLRFTAALRPLVIEEANAGRETASALLMPTILYSNKDAPAPVRSDRKEEEEPAKEEEVNEKIDRVADAIVAKKHEPTVEVTVIATNPEGEVEVAPAKLSGNTIHDIEWEGESEIPDEVFAGLFA